MGGWIDGGGSGGSMYFPLIGVYDSDSSNLLKLDWNENDTLDRNLTFKVGGADREITLSGSPTLADWFDQSVKTSASPTFTALTFKGTGSYNTTFQAGAASANKTYTWPLTDGTSGQALTTNASAVLSWTTISGYTDAQARLAIASSATGLTYTNTTGVFTLTASYVIPTTTEESNWNTAYGYVDQSVKVAGTPSFASVTSPTITLGSVAANGILNLYGLHANGYYNIIKGSNAEGLVGADLRIGLDETNRTLIICDRGDIDTDFGTTASSDPTICFVNSTGDRKVKMGIIGYGSFSIAWETNGIGCTIDTGGALTLGGQYASSTMRGTTTCLKLFGTDLAAGNAHTIDSDTNIELTDSDGQQAWVYIEPKINQTGTAAVDCLYVNPTLTSVGTGATGDGNNLLRLAVSATTKFRIDTKGHVHGGDSASLTDTSVLITTIADTWNGFAFVTCSDNVVAAYRVEAGTLAVISANAAFGLVQGVDTLWNVYFASNVLKIENQRGTTQTAKILFIGY